jgi:hypothetical protein
MSLHLNISPQVEARFKAAARRKGIDPASFFEQIVSSHLSSSTPETNTVPTVDAESAAVIALMDEWLAEAPVDQEGARQAKTEIDELMHNLNKNRIESGESPLV